MSRLEGTDANEAQATTTGGGPLSLIAGTVDEGRLSAADRALRELQSQYAEEDAPSAWHRCYLPRLIEMWRQWNQDYFEGRLIAPEVRLSEPASPMALGDYANWSGIGSPGQIRLRPSLLTGTHTSVRGGSEFEEGRFRFVADVLLHETGHQLQHEIHNNLEDGYHGHGPLFRDYCNFIGARLRLPPVRTSKKRGPDKDLPSCSQWPHNVRPPEYYLGAYVPTNGDIDGARRAVLEMAVEFERAHVRVLVRTEAGVELSELDRRELETWKDQLHKAALRYGRSKRPAEEE